MGNQRNTLTETLQVVYMITFPMALMFTMIALAMSGPNYTNNIASQVSDDLKLGTTK